MDTVTVVATLAGSFVLAFTVTFLREMWKDRAWWMEVIRTWK